MIEDADKNGSQEKTFCLEGNGQRPSHRGDGYIESDIMYTLNSIEQHAVYAVGRCAGFKAGQSMAGSLGYEDEISPTLSAMPSGLEPTVVIYGNE